ASTGGFTDVLLQRGAARVIAVDVGYGQLAWSLRQDPRVTVMERVNIRYLDRLPVPADLAVIDVSFISLRLVLPRVRELLSPPAAGGARLPRLDLWRHGGRTSRRARRRPQRHALDPECRRRRHPAVDGPTGGGGPHPGTRGQRRSPWLSHPGPAGRGRQGARP